MARVESVRIGPYGRLAAAEQAALEGRHEDAVAEGRLALAAPELTGSDRARAMGSLANSYARASCWDLAEGTARAAVALAATQNDELSEAYCQLMLGTVLLEMKTASGESPASDRVAADNDNGELFDALERATDLYEKSGTLDFYTCLLTMGDAIRLRVETEVKSAEKLYLRVLNDLHDNPRWSQTELLANKADYLCARAAYGIAEIAQRHGDSEKTRTHLEAAARYLVASAVAPVNRGLLASVAEDFRRWLSDAPRADELLSIVHGEGEAHDGYRK
jgi:hypothetical protein